MRTINGSRKNSCLGLNDKDKPLITVATVAYNASPYIETTIKSVIGQTYNNIEYIIIDGKSDDNTPEIIKQYENKIDVWISEKDSGVYEAMNKAIDLATGDWLIFMNAGDTFADAETLSMIVEKILPGSEILYGDMVYVKNHQKMLQKAKPVETIFQGMPFSHQATLVKTDLIKTYKFNETYKFAADYEFLIRLYKNSHAFQYINIPICVFSSGGKSESGLRPHLEALKILFDNCEDIETIKKNVYFKCFRVHCSYLLSESVKKHSRIEAFFWRIRLRLRWMAMSLTNHRH